MNNLSVLVEWDPKYKKWYAHCIECDLIVDGDSREEVVEDILSIIITHLEVAKEKGLDPYSSTTPQYVKDRYNALGISFRFSDEVEEIEEDEPLWFGNKIRETIRLLFSKRRK